MSFYGKSFVFNSKPSDVYNLYITSLDGGQETHGLGDVEVLLETVFRRAKPYFLGASQSSSVLTIPAMINSPDVIDAPISGAIEKWLFGQLGYKKLQIIQPDMLDVYFNCFLKNPSMLKTGNQIRGYSFDIECDAPWAWQFEKTLTKTYTAETVSDSFSFKNTSDNNDYLYPKTTITINEFGGDITITNASDNSRIFQITDLSANEVLTIDNDLGILTSSTDLLRMGTFNKNWFRLVSGNNEISIDGNVASFVMNYSFARKVS